MIKLLTIWHGPTPVWYPYFQQRVKTNRYLQHELIKFPNSKHMNNLVESKIGVKCVKSKPYFLCDIRPLLADLYPEKISGFQWWGWVDLDIVLGNLERTLFKIMADHDVIRLDDGGPMTLMRNKEEVNHLYRLTEDYKEVLADSEYCNFDEDGFGNPGNPSMDWLLKGSGLRVYHDNRTWTDSHEMMPNGGPSRCCKLIGGYKLVEIPTNRELVFYHFTSKEWPIPNKWDTLTPEQIDQYRRKAALGGRNPPPPKPEESPEYWSRRVLNRNPETPLHHIVFDANVNDWTALQNYSKEVIEANIPKGSWVLDAGCSYGALLDVLDSDTQYTGIDYCPAMIDLAKSLYSDQNFTLGNLKQLPFTDDSFDWCICRGLEGSIRTLVSNRDWNAMVKEMLRVAPKLLLINMSYGHRIVERQ